ncbi:MAG: hypothetical protein CTY15_13710 [Methylocystis sp.]|nr:MAG: hypothetical protein CTY15_13710 [Methylocystis sp.]
MKIIETRRAATLYLALSLTLCWVAARSLAPAFDGWRLVLSKDDPVALSEARIDGLLTPERFSAQFDAALSARDLDLASSLVELGKTRALAPTLAQETRLTELRTDESKKAIENFAEGFLRGARDSGAAFAGAVASDLSGFGDVRDLWTEGEKVRRGEAPDELVIGLAAAGLALSAVTWSSVGAMLPARSGLTFVKSAQKAGRLSRPLARAMTAAAAKAVDREALTAGASALAKLDFASARSVAPKIVRPGALGNFRLLGEDAALLYRHAGARGAKDALALAENGAELGKAAKLAAAKGGATRAILAMLGRGALVLGALAAGAVEAIFAFLGALLGLAMLAQRFGFWLGRAI